MSMCFFESLSWCNSILLCLILHCVLSCKKYFLAASLTCRLTVPAHLKSFSRFFSLSQQRSWAVRDPWTCLNLYLLKVSIVFKENLVCLERPKSSAMSTFTNPKNIFIYQCQTWKRNPMESEPATSFFIQAFQGRVTPNCLKKYSNCCFICNLGQTTAVSKQP